MSAPARIVTVNPGSHSLQLGLFAGERTERSDEIDDDPTGTAAGTALSDFLADAAADGPIDVISYRLVHGGDLITEPTAIDDRLRRDLDRFTPLAPGHNPATLACIDQARTTHGSAVHLICPDTAFHSSMPPRATTLAVPRHWRDRYGARRYGFHGVSYGWAVQRAAQLLAANPDSLNLIITHLGGGCSVCATHNGRSIWTTMGMTPADGLVMTRRSGAVDPGLLLWLQSTHGLSADEIRDALQRDSGLLALSAGRSADTRDLVAAAADGDSDAALAMEIFTDSVRRNVAAAATMLPGLDAIVFTGEIGYDQPEVRDAVCGGLGMLGVPTALKQPEPGDRIISPAGAHPAVLTIETGEAAELARLARQFLQPRR
ncbi:hypothetical protein [Microlunatus soli]|uniref:Acetate kinase n=1 Tax=Microlunatus soli TaxID=630515 RepID=A0A1H1N425_9ACTN|nr:hypothetical protein [Microlunatus soli]SDR93638.1 acetate kinase [Microlunatus soli]